MFAEEVGRIKINPFQTARSSKTRLRGAKVVKFGGLIVMVAVRYVFEACLPFRRIPTSSMPRRPSFLRIDGFSERLRLWLPERFLHRQDTTIAS